MIPSSNHVHHAKGDSALPQKPYCKCVFRSLLFSCDKTGFRTSEEARHLSCSFDRKANTAQQLLWLTIPHDCTSSIWKLNHSLLTMGSAPEWDSCYLSRIFEAVVFPILCKALVESQLVRAWHAEGLTKERVYPGWTSVDLFLQLDTTTRGTVDLQNE